MQNKDFIELLQPIHKNHTKSMYKKLLQKIYNLKQNLKSRSKKQEIEFDVTLDELKKMIYQVYGKQCPYCDRILTVHNMTCDHIVPIIEKGGSTIDNLQMTCDICNRSKGPLDNREYRDLLNYLNNQTEKVKEYVLSKLRRGSNY